MTASEENKSFEINGVEIMLDEDGFMQSPEMWNEEVGKGEPKNGIIVDQDISGDLK